ncbi:MAG: restriction endonuclease [Motiliproteus sp.]
MDGYLQTGIGIFVSIILFAIGYRQTFGARKERSKSANLSIHRAIIRRMVLENYDPIYKDIGRIIEGKAREFNASKNDLLSVEQVLNTLYTEVFDSDLISPGQRIEIEKRLLNCFEKIENKPSKLSFKELNQINKERTRLTISLVMMVIVTSLLGATAPILFKIVETKTVQIDWLISGVGIFIGSIAVLTSLIMYRKNKEIGTVSSTRTAQIKLSTFENEIASILNKHGFDFTFEPYLGNMRPDFLVEANGKTIAIEAKDWSGVISEPNLRSTSAYLRNLLNNKNVDQVILVTKNKVDLSSLEINSNNISIRTINELPLALNVAA